MLSVDLGAVVDVTATFKLDTNQVEAFAQLGNAAPIPLTVQTVDARHYSAVFTPPSPGRWYVRVQSGDPNPGAAEGWVKVKPPAVTP